LDRTDGELGEAIGNRLVFGGDEFGHVFATTGEDFLVTGVKGDEFGGVIHVAIYSNPTA
jgi:hypothetical protein